MYLYLRWLLFLCNTVGLILLICSLALSCDICVEGREVRSFGFESTWFFEDTTYNFIIIIILVRARVAQWVR